MRSGRVVDESSGPNDDYIIADSSYHGGQTNSGASSPSPMSVSTSSTRDVEQGMEIDHNAAYFKDVKVVHKTIFSRRRVRAACLGIGMLLVLFILFQMSFSSPPSGNISAAACDVRISAPYTSNRNVTWELCAAHMGDNWSNLLLKTAVLPDDRQSQSSIRFLVLGDFGRDGYCCQRDVAIEMNRAMSDLGGSFVINTGDAFYDSGIETPLDEQVRTSFLNVYNQSKLKETQFLSVLGNHDYRGSANAVLALDAKYRRWTMPGRYWSTTKSSGNVNVQFVFIDTAPMIDSYAISGYESAGDLILKRKDGIVSQWPLVDSQIKWLENQLTSGQYDMRIVVGHHAIFGLTSHKGENRTTLQNRVGPLLEKYNVTAYIAGHEHNLQLAQVNEVAHFISGAGSKIAPAYEAPDTPRGSTTFYYSEHGFLACSIFKDQLIVAAVDMSGNVLESVQVPARPTPKRSGR
jgi:tartrate-resistant acid phosphatase type 5